MTAATEPDQRVHGVNSFICGDGGCVVAFHEKPERSIAGAICEDAGDWLGLLRNLERRNVPDGVMSAVETALEAVANWVDWLDRAENTNTPTVRKPRRPDDAV